MQDTKDFRAYVETRVKNLRAEADALEKSIEDFSANPKIAEATYAPSNVTVMSPRAPRPVHRQATSDAQPSKYAPMIAAWESQPDKGFTHPELFELAKKTVRDISNENAVRTFVFSLKRSGQVHERDGKLFINKSRSR